MRPNGLSGLGFNPHENHSRPWGLKGLEHQVISSLGLCLPTFEPLLERTGRPKDGGASRLEDPTLACHPKPSAASPRIAPGFPVARHDPVVAFNAASGSRSKPRKWRIASKSCTSRSLRPQFACIPGRQVPVEAALSTLTPDSKHQKSRTRVPPGCPGEMGPCLCDVTCSHG